MNKVKAQILTIGPATQHTEKFKSMNVLVEMYQDTQYPQKVPFQASNDKCSLFDNIKVGDQVEISYVFRGSEYQGKNYSTNDIRGIVKL